MIASDPCFNEEKRESHKQQVTTRPPFGCFWNDVFLKNTKRVKIKQIKKKDQKSVTLIPTLHITLLYIVSSSIE